MPIPTRNLYSLKGVVLTSPPSEDHLQSLTAGEYIEFTSKIADKEYAERELTIPQWKAYVVMLHYIEDGKPVLVNEVKKLSDKEDNLFYETAVPLPVGQDLYHTLRGINGEVFFQAQENFRCRVPWEWLADTYDVVNSLITPVSEETKQALKND